MRFAGLLIFCFLFACSSNEEKKTATTVARLRTNNDNIRKERSALPLGPDRLSDFGFFQEPIAALKPANGVIPYDLNMPLFSDYADKSRFVTVPQGEVVTVAEDGTLVFPEGTKLIKTFHYPAENEAGRKLLETRVIEKEKGQWKALTYIWNDEQTEAFLEVAGGNIDVERKTDGVLQRINYSIPDINQCKTCHGRGNAITPLGPKIAQLNKPFSYPDGSTQNQLAFWKDKGLLALNSSPEEMMRFPGWDSALKQPAVAARAYLDANCGSCHHPAGSANTSGLFLTMDVTEGSKYGVMKKPVAAGKGSGGRLYGIVPGKPDESILVYRMESTDPGIMMPELGRSLRHEEGVALVRAWIGALGNDPTP
jgi:uncharacterized repeat protein (TIGR03806 family)